MFDDLYVINQDISDKVNKMINEFQINEGEFNEGILMFENLIHLHLLKDFKRNTKNKIITPIFYYQVLVNEVTNNSTLSFHAEHALMRLTSFWEHLFQILNTYLGINNSPRRVIEENEEWGIVKRKYVFNKRSEFGKYVSTNNKVLVSSKFLSHLKKIYRNDSHFRRLINLSNQSHWKEIRSHRNDIIHHKFIGQSSFVMNATEEQYSIMMYNNFEKDFGYSNLSELFSKAVKDIKKALEDTFVLLKKDLVPNKKSSSKEQQFLIKIKCDCEEKIKAVPDIFLTFDEKLKRTGSPFRGIFCTSCFSDKVTILEDKVNISEMNCDELVTEYYKKSFLYLEKKISSSII
ncbi:hypothetical protein ACH0B6_14115 [Solibacillus silvestris]